MARGGRGGRQSRRRMTDPPVHRIRARMTSMIRKRSANNKSSSSSSKKKINVAPPPLDPNRILQTDWLVQTPYGIAKVVDVRSMDDIRYYDLDLIELTRNAPCDTTIPRLVTCCAYPSIAPQVGSDVVLTCFHQGQQQQGGLQRGRVVQVRPRQRQVVVQLVSWQLMQSDDLPTSFVNSPTCYLSYSAVQVVTPKHVSEMSVYEKLLYIHERRTVASQLFAKQKWKPALDFYESGLVAIRSLLYHHTNTCMESQRANVILTKIKCASHASTCCWNLRDYSGVVKYSMNALRLLKTLEVNGKLLHLSYKDEKLDGELRIFGSWRVKALTMLAKAFIELEQWQPAKDVLQKAHKLVLKFLKGAKEGAQKKGREEPTARVAQLIRADRTILRLYAKVECMRAKRNKFMKSNSEVVVDVNKSPKSNSPSRITAATTATTACSSEVNSQDNSNDDGSVLSSDSVSALGIEEDRDDWLIGSDEQEEWPPLDILIPPALLVNHQQEEVTAPEPDATKPCLQRAPPKRHPASFKVVGGEQPQQLFTFSFAPPPQKKCSGGYFLRNRRLAVPLDFEEKPAVESRVACAGTTTTKVVVDGEEDLKPKLEKPLSPFKPLSSRTNTLLQVPLCEGTKVVREQDVEMKPKMEEPVASMPSPQGPSEDVQKVVEEDLKSKAENVVEPGTSKPQVAEVVVVENELKTKPTNEDSVDSMPPLPAQAPSVPPSVGAKVVAEEDLKSMTMEAEEPVDSKSRLQPNTLAPARCESILVVGKEETNNTSALYDANPPAQAFIVETKPKKVESAVSEAAVLPREMGCDDWRENLTAVIKEAPKQKMFSDDWRKNLTAVMPDHMRTQHQEKKTKRKNEKKLSLRSRSSGMSRKHTPPRGRLEDEIELEAFSTGRKVSFADEHAFALESSSGDAVKQEETKAWYQDPQFLLSVGAVVAGGALTTVVAASYLPKRR